MKTYYLRNFFNHVRQKHSVITGNSNIASRKNYYFVDTNVIIGYRRKQFDTEIPEFIKFIEDKTNEFLYTESVLEELKQPGISYPESSKDPNIPDKRFRFVESGISLSHKEKTIDLLHDLWDSTFPVGRANIEKGFGLSEDPPYTTKNSTELKKGL